MEKDFTHWHNVKSEIQNQEHNSLKLFKEREIWWCKIGINVGDEEDGKNEDCSRPILIIKKYNNHIFLGVPLTTRLC